MKSRPFLTDIKTLRERARLHIENGAVTSEIGGEPNFSPKGSSPEVTQSTSKE
jgi:hypothetical protein